MKVKSGVCSPDFCVVVFFFSSWIEKMEKYKVHSVRVTVNQMVSVDMVRAGNKINALFPAKFAPILSTGTAVKVFSSKFDKNLQLAFVFESNVLFRLSPDGVFRARIMFDLIPGLSDFSLDKFRFCRAIQDSLRKCGIKSTGSLFLDIALIQKQNQK